MKFRKKPVVIEAKQFNGNNAAELIQWAHMGLPDLANSIVTRDYENILTIRTLEGYMACIKGDWLIKGVKGEFYPCKPDIFDATYEKVEE